MIKLKNIINEVDLDTLNGMKTMRDVHFKKLIGYIPIFARFYIDVAMNLDIGKERKKDGTRYTISDFNYNTINRILKDCDRFQQKYRKIYEAAGWDDGKAGYDFYLTRNHHGSGFLSRGSTRNDTLYKTKLSEYPEKIKQIAKILTHVSQKYGEYHLYIGDDNLIYGN